MELRVMAAELEDTPARVQPLHAAIVEAIRAGDRRAARRAMADHMDEAAATFERARLLSVLGPARA